MKNKVILLLILLISTVSYTQIVDIPDPNFKNALVNTLCVDTDGDYIVDSNVDTNNDGEIQVSEAETVTFLNVSSNNIESMVGIQSFVNLQVLQCTDNLITAIDVSQNLNLTNLSIGNNLLTNIDVKENIQLKSLNFSYNKIANINVSYNLNLDTLIANNNLLYEIDVSNNLSLYDLSFFNNQISYLDCSQHSNLVFLIGFNNQLTYLNINNNNNSILEFMSVFDNPSLFCIQVDDVDYANNYQGWIKDNWAEYNEDCSLGLNEALETQLFIYPNPSKNVLMFFNESDYNIKSIKVYDVLGQLVLKENNFENQLSISDLDNGLFFVKIETDQGVSTQKVIKQ